MRRRIVFALVAIVVVVFLVGCKSVPPDEVKTGISLLSDGVDDYVGHEQPAIEARLKALEDRLAETEDEDERKAIEGLIAEEQQYLDLGKEIPPTVEELSNWAEGKPLPKAEEKP